MSKNKEHLRALLFGEEETQPQKKSNIWGDEEDDLFDEKKVGFMTQRRLSSDFKSPSLKSSTSLFSSTPNINYDNKNENILQQISQLSEKEDTTNNRDDATDSTINNTQNNNNYEEESPLKPSSSLFDDSPLQFDAPPILLSPVNNNDPKNVKEQEGGEFFFDPLLNVLTPPPEEVNSPEPTNTVEEVKEKSSSKEPKAAKGVDRIFEMMGVVGIPPSRKSSSSSSSDIPSFSPSTPPNPSFLSTPSLFAPSSSPSKRNILHRSVFNLQNIAEAKLLFSYTGDVDFQLPEKKLLEFCFPAGISKRKVQRGSKNLTEIYYGQNHLHDSNNSFIFMLTGGEVDTLYGVCVSKEEPIQDLPRFIKNEEGAIGEGANDGEQSTQVEIAPRVYCLISKYPYFTIHYDILYSIIAHERLMRINNDFKEDIDLKVNRDQITEILAKYMNSKVPRPGDHYQLSLPFDHKNLSFYCPLGDVKTTLLTNWCMTTPFRLLSLENIIHFFSSLLQEYQIAVISRNFGALSCTILSIIPMIRPLEWQGLLVPILPLTLKETLHAPVPYVIGISEISEKERSVLNEGGVVIVDLDSDTLLLPKNFVLLPEFKKLEEDLRAEHIYLYKNFSSENPYYISDEHISRAQNIFFSFNRYCKWFTDNVCKRFANVKEGDYEERDQVKVEMLKRVPRNNVNYMKNFLDTQHFTNYLDSYLKSSASIPLL